MSARGHEKLLRNLRCQRMSTSPSSDCRRDDHGCRFVPNTPIMRPILGRRELVEIDPDHEFRLRQLPGDTPVIRGGVADQGDGGPHTIPIATASERREHSHPLQSAETGHVARPAPPAPGQPARFPAPAATGISSPTACVLTGQERSRRICTGVPKRSPAWNSDDTRSTRRAGGERYNRPPIGRSVSGGLTPYWSRRSSRSSPDTIRPAVGAAISGNNTAGGSSTARSRRGEPAPR